MKSNIKTIDNETARKRLNILSIIFAFNTLLFLMTGSFCLLTALTVYKLCPELPLNGGNSIHDRAPNISFPEILKQDRFFLLFITLSISALLASVGSLWIGFNKLPR